MRWAALAPRIGPHRHAGEAIAAGKMDAVMSDEMGPEIEGAGAAPGPGMRDLERRDLGHDAHGVEPELRALVARTGRPRAGAPQEENAGAVGRAAHRDDVVDMVDIGA